MALGLIWKPKGLGSQEALGLLKNQLQLPTKGREGVGHTGILDPFAEGCLLCGTEEGTKLLAPLSGLDKGYEATICLGRASDTLDDTGVFEDPQGAQAERVQRWLALDDETLDSQLRLLLHSVVGSSFDQIPPQFSAVHVDGKRSYEWARKGVFKELKARRVSVYEAQHLGWRRNEAGLVLWDIRVNVSAGTYIRAFARDWGLKLMGFPGHLTRLVRYAVGPLGRQTLPPEPAFWNPLTLEDFKFFFDIQYLTYQDAERLRKNGSWTPKRHSKPCILVGSGGLGAVAWTEAGSGKIGRVFRSNPF